MILADTYPSWQSTLAVLAMLVSGLGLICSGLVVYFMAQQTRLMREQAGKPSEIEPQPLRVQIDEELHQRFAAKDEFEAHVASNTERHAQIFKRIENAEREARGNLSEEITRINTDRARTMEKLNDQFTFIRESLAAINTELKMSRSPTRNL